MKFPKYKFYFLLASACLATVAIGVNIMGGQKFAEGPFGTVWNFGWQKDSVGNNVGGVTVEENKVVGQVWSDLVGWIEMQPDIFAEGERVTVSVVSEDIDGDQTLEDIGRLSGTAVAQGNNDLIWFGKWDTDGDGNDDADTGVYIDGKGYFQGVAWSKHFGAIAFGDYMLLNSVSSDRTDSIDDKVTHWARTHWIPNVVQFETTTSSGGEELTVADLVISVSNAPARDMTVDYVVSGGTAVGGGEDFTLADGTAVIRARSKSGHVKVLINEDRIDEVDETVEVTLSNPSMGSLGANAVHTYTIEDNDTAYLSISESPDSSRVEGASGETNVVSFIVKLSTPSASEVTFDIGFADDTATAGIDYITPVVTSGSIAAGSTATYVDVTVNGDDDDEGVEETFTVTLSNVIGAASIPTDLIATGSILDDDGIPVLSIFAGSVSENLGIVFPEVALSGTSSSEVTVNYAVTGGTAASGTDYAAVSGGTLTWAAGETGVKSFSISLIDDGFDEVEENIIFTLSDPVNAFLSDAGTSAELKIIDDDEPPVIYLKESTSVRESAGVARVVANLSKVAEGVVTVGYSTSDGTAVTGSDYGTATGVISWPAGTAGEKEAFVQITDDSDEEEVEAFDFVLANASGALIANGKTKIFIVDNDEAVSAAVDEDYSSDENVKVDVPAYNEGIAEFGVGTTDVLLRPDQKLDISAGVKSELPSVVVADSQSVASAMAKIRKASFAAANVDTVKIESGVEGENMVIGSTDDLEIEIPDETTIYADEDWDGVIEPPSDVTATITPMPGFTLNGAVSVGSDDYTLVFDKPAKLTLPSDSGTPFYSIDGGANWEEIVNECTSSTGDGIVFPDECFYRNGGNTLIWTYHFSDFGEGDGDDGGDGDDSGDGDSGGDDGGDSGSSSTVTATVSSSGKAKIMRRRGQKRGEHIKITGAGVSKEAFPAAYEKSMKQVEEWNEGVAPKILTRIDPFGNEVAYGYMPGILSQDEHTIALSRKAAISMKRRKNLPEYYGIVMPGGAGGLHGSSPSNELVAQFGTFRADDVSVNNQYYDDVMGMMAFGLMKTNDNHEFLSNAKMGWKGVVAMALRAQGKGVGSFGRLLEADLPSLRGVELSTKNEDGLIFYTALREGLIDATFDKNKLPTKGDVDRILRIAFYLSDEDELQSARFNVTQAITRAEFANWFMSGYKISQKNSSDAADDGLLSQAKLVRKLFAGGNESIEVYSLGANSEPSRLMFYRSAPKKNSQLTSSGR